MSTTSVNSVYSWQYNVTERISRLEDGGFTVFQQDESIFLYDVISSRKYWPEIGIPIIFPYTVAIKKVSYMAQLQNLINSFSDYTTNLI